jgi:hypothetical protein
VGSLSSLLEQLPAQSVRLVVFNLDQQAVLFQQDGFATKDVEKVVTALNQLQLALVDYRTLQKRASASGLLVDLVQAELRGPKSPDALILLGPRSPIRDDISPEALDKFPPAIPGLFYLQYQPRLPPHAGSMPGPMGQHGDPLSMASLAFRDGPDSIEKLLGRLKGKTIAVRTAHDFADAIRHIEAGIGRTAVPEQAVAVKLPSMAPVLPATETPLARPRIGRVFKQVRRCWYRQCGAQWADRLGRFRGIPDGRLQD